MSDALPLQEQKSKIEFAKRLLDALRHCGDNPDYEVLDNLCRSVLSGAIHIEMEYLSIHLGFLGDDAEAKAWEQWRTGLIKKAALAGVTDAQYEYGLIAFESEDFERSFKLFQSAARLGYAPALYSVGWAYFYGRGVAEDRDKGIEYIELAAGQLFNLAIGFLIEFHKDDAVKRARYEMMLSWATRDIPDV